MQASPCNSFGPVLLAEMMDACCEGAELQVLLLPGVWDGIETRGNSSHGSPIWPHHTRRSSLLVMCSRDASLRCVVGI